METPDNAPEEEYVVVAAASLVTSIEAAAEPSGLRNSSGIGTRTRRGLQPPIRSQTLPENAAPAAPPRMETSSRSDPPPPYQPSIIPVQPAISTHVEPSAALENLVHSPKFPGYLPSIAHTYPPLPPPAVQPEPIKDSQTLPQPQNSFPDPPPLDLDAPIASSSRVSPPRPRLKIDTGSSADLKAAAANKPDQRRLGKKTSKNSVGSSASPSELIQPEPRRRLASASNLPNQQQTQPKPKLTLNTKASTDDVKHPLTSATIARRQRVAQANGTARLSVASDVSADSSNGGRSRRRGVRSGEVSATATSTSSSNSDSPSLSSISVSPFAAIIPSFGLGRKPSQASMSTGTKRSAPSIIPSGEAAGDDATASGTDSGTEGSVTKKRRVGQGPTDTTPPPPPPQPYVEPIRPIEVEKEKERHMGEPEVRDDSMVEDEDSWSFSPIEDEFKTPAPVRKSSRILHESRSIEPKSLLSLFEPPPPVQKSPPPTISKAKSPSVISPLASASTHRSEITFQRPSQLVANEPSNPPASVSTHPPPASETYWKTSAAPPIQVSHPGQSSSAATLGARATRGSTAAAVRGMRLRSARGKP